MYLCALCTAVDASEFEPAPGKPWPRDCRAPITIVALSRLVYRKGIDIMALVIPEVCHRHPNVNFIIGEERPCYTLATPLLHPCYTLLGTAHRPTQFRPSLSCNVEENTHTWSHTSISKANHKSQPACLFASAANGMGPKSPCCARMVVSWCHAGGDGPKKALLQQMISTEGLEGRVSLAGAIPHERARDFLVGVTHTPKPKMYSSCSLQVMLILLAPIPALYHCVKKGHTGWGQL